MQLANYNETNGIVVGPEVSRIFEEVILQQIDLNVLSKLENSGLKYGVDFEVRRYVDDFSTTAVHHMFGRDAGSEKRAIYIGIHN